VRRASWRAAAAITALACAAASACSTTRPLPYPAQRITVGRFSFLPPDEPDWFAAAAEPGDFNAVRLGSGQDETYSLTAEPAHGEFPVPTDQASIAKLNARLSDSLSKHSEGRLELQSGRVELWTRLGVRCLRSRTVNLDREPVRISGGYKSMLLTTVTFTCGHPSDPLDHITLGLAQRCDAGHEDPALEEKAESVAATLEFLP
jgi:hypothetical protein